MIEGKGLDTSSAGEGKGLEASEEEIGDEVDGVVVVERYNNGALLTNRHTVEKELFRNVRTFVDRAVSPIEDELHELMKETKVGFS